MRGMVSAQVLIDLLYYCVLHVCVCVRVYVEEGDSRPTVLSGREWHGGGTQVQNQAETRAITQQERLSGLAPSYTAH